MVQGQRGPFCCDFCHWPLFQPCEPPCSPSGAEPAEEKHRTAMATPPWPATADHLATGAAAHRAECSLGAILATANIACVAPSS